jgi:hypothetical protein
MKSEKQLKLYHRLSFPLSLQEDICKPVTDHILPVGWSLEQRDFITKVNRHPLLFMRIGVVSDTKYFLKFWELVLKGAGADVFRITQETSKLCTFHCAWIVIPVR